MKKDKKDKKNKKEIKIDLKKNSYKPFIGLIIISLLLAYLVPHLYK